MLKISASAKAAAEAAAEKAAAEEEEEKAAAEEEEKAAAEEAAEEAASCRSLLISGVGHVPATPEMKLARKTANVKSTPRYLPC